MESKAIAAADRFAFRSGHLSWLKGKGPNALLGFSKVRCEETNEVRLIRWLHRKKWKFRKPLAGVFLIENNSACSKNSVKRTIIG
ncbi:hypothetical protein [Gracilibacillus alcaliphilus]